jgi:hypothetical protein
VKKIILLALLGGVAFLFSRCGSGKEETAKTAPPAATLPAPVEAGKTFNARFPKSGGGFDVVFTQEKDGYAQADLTREGKKLAQLSLSDTNANPGARDKFAASAKKIGGHPAAAVGSMGTAVLVAGRYQVQARSLDKSFTESDRAAWIAKFDLGGLR